MHLMLSVMYMTVEKVGKVRHSLMPLEVLSDRRRFLLIPYMVRL